MVAYNVESGAAEASTVAKAIKGVKEVGVWGFSELASFDWFETFEAAIGNASGGTDYGKIIGTTGEYDDPNRDPDYLAFLFNKTTIEKIEVRQLHSINDWKHLSPLAILFRHKVSNELFVVVLNHLVSGDPNLRLQQTW